VKRGTAERQAQRDLFEITNSYGSRLFSLEGGPPFAPKGRLVDRGPVDSWIVVRVEDATAGVPFWVLWRSLWYVDELPSPYPCDFWGTVHLMRVVEWDFDEGILAEVNQYDNAKRGRRSVAGMQNKLHKGGWPFGPPVGYSRTLDVERRKTIAPDPARAGLIRQAFEMFATGLHKREDVLKQITAMGLRTPSGKALTSQTFERLLKNPLYAGIVEVATWDIRQKGNFQPVVSDSVFRAVQALFAGKRLSITPRRRFNPEFPLRHFVTCGRCGRPLTGGKSKGRSALYLFYHCQNRRCPSQVRIRAEKLEALFLDLLKRLQPTTEYLSLYRKVVLDVWGSKQADSTQLREAAEKRVKELRDRKAKLNEAYVYQQALSREDYEQMRGIVDADLAIADIEAGAARKLPSRSLKRGGSSAKRSASFPMASRPTPRPRNTVRLTSCD
jgi:hypothetical protein